MAQFATVSQLKDWLTLGQTPFPPTDDQMLIRLLVAGSSAIESYCGRPFDLGTYEEIIDGWSGASLPSLPLIVTPITTVVSLNIGGFDVPPAPDAFGPGYFINRSQLTLRGWWGRFSYRNRVVVRYTGGYAPIPDDIVQACIEIAARKYKERSRIGQRSASIGGAETVAYDTVMFAVGRIASDIQATLNPYRQLAPLGRPTFIPPP